MDCLCLSKIICYNHKGVSIWNALKVPPFCLSPLQCKCNQTRKVICSDGVEEICIKLVQLFIITTL